MQRSWKSVGDCWRRSGRRDCGDGRRSLLLNTGHADRPGPAVRSRARTRAPLEPGLRHGRRRLLLAPGLAARRRRARRHRGSTPPLIIRLIDVVTALDPWVGHPYRFAAVWLTDERSRAFALRTACSSAASPTTRSTGATATTSASTTSSTSRRTCRAADVLEEALPLDGRSQLPGRPRREAALESRRAADGRGLPLRAGSKRAGRIRRAEYLKALDEIETERRARYLDAAREEYWRRHGRDIESVEDLRRGPEPIVPQLPAAHPQFDFFEWVLDRDIRPDRLLLLRIALRAALDPAGRPRGASAGASSGPEGEGRADAGRTPRDRSDREHRQGLPSRLRAAQEAGAARHLVQRARRRDLRLRRPQRRGQDDDAEGADGTDPRHLGQGLDPRPRRARDGLPAPDRLPARESRTSTPS